MREISENISGKNKIEKSLSKGRSEVNLKNQNIKKGFLKLLLFI